MTITTGMVITTALNAANERGFKYIVFAYNGNGDWLLFNDLRRARNTAEDISAMMCIDTQVLSAQGYELYWFQD